MSGCLMFRPFAVASILLLMVPSSPTPGTALPEFAGSTHIHAQGVKYARIWLPANATLDGLEMRTQSERAAFLLTWSEGFLFSLKVGDAVVTVGEGDELAQGIYTGYAYAIPGFGMTVTLRFRGLAGSQEVTATSETNGVFHRLEPSGIGALLPQERVQRLSGDQAFDGDAISGFMVSSSATAVRQESMEYRWSTSEGSTACWGLVSGALTSGPAPSLTAVLYAAGHGGRVQLDFFHYSASVAPSLDVHGIWIQRAAEDPAPWTAVPRKPVVAVPEPLDYDLDCLRHHWLSG